MHRIRPPRNRGALLLRKYFQRPSAVAKRLNTSASTLSRLMDGTRKPSKRLAHALEMHFAIPVVAWDEEIEN